MKSYIVTTVADAETKDHEFRWPMYAIAFYICNVNRVGHNLKNIIFSVRTKSGKVIHMDHLQDIRK